MFVVGNLYNRRRDIHSRFGGQQQGGISTPANQPFILLFTGSSGEAYGYTDGLADDGTYRYFGEGQVGDMGFERGNKAILNHARNSKSLMLFETRGKGKPVRFLGEFGLDDWEYATAPDIDGRPRQAIVFKLRPIDAWVGDISDDPIEPGSSMGELRARALAASDPKASDPRSGKPRTYYERSKAVRDYVLTRAEGKCECCKSGAPFVRKDGSPYLEPHHIRRLSDGGPDHPSSVAAVCPNCHRRIHHGSDGQALNERLAVVVHSIESSFD